MSTAKKKNRSNRAWIQRHVTDPFVKRSVQEGFRSRAAYKRFLTNYRLADPGLPEVAEAREAIK